MMMMIMIIIIIIIIIVITIIIALKGTNFTISSLCHEPSSTRMLKWPGRSHDLCKSCATQSQHVVLHATWYKGTAQL